MRDNLWSRDAAALAAAYTQGRSQLRFEVARRAIVEHTGPGRKRIVDIGGGYGQQAITFAREGHEVVIVDFDPNMLDLARSRAAAEPEEVRQRISYICGDGLHAPTLAGRDFDVACCHSVLMYEADPVPLIRSVSESVRDGGVVSVLSINPAASAMRGALQGRWTDARRSLEAGREMGLDYLPGSDPSLEFVSGALADAGVRTEQWYGIGIFVEHLTNPVPQCDLVDLYEVEWLAGSQDPYRSIARCFHLVGRKRAPVGQQ